MGKELRRQTAPLDAAEEPPDLDSLRMAEQIESCRAHAASVTKLAAVTSRALYECYQYEENEPHLGQCCELVHHVLEQAESAIVSLGVVSYDIEARTRVAEIENCETQGQCLSRAMHVVRATIALLDRPQSNNHAQVLLALHNLERGIGSVIDSLGRATQKLPRAVPWSPEH